MLRSYKIAAAASIVSLSALGLGTASIATASTSTAAAKAHMVPASTAITAALASGTKLTAAGAIDGVTITVSCTSLTASGKTPANGLSATITGAPVFSGCTDSLGGADTVNTNTTNGKWSIALASSGKTGTLDIPKGGVTFSSNVLPSCVVTLAPSAAAKVKATYNDVNTATFKNATVATSGSGCTTTSAKIDSTVVLTPGVSVAG